MGHQFAYSRPQQYQQRYQLLYKKPFLGKWRLHPYQQYQKEGCDNRYNRFKGKSNDRKPYHKDWKKFYKKQ